MADDRATVPLDVAVDNDVLIKVSCWDLAPVFARGRSIGVLGAARYVVPDRIGRMPLNGDRELTRSAAQALIASCAALEPSADEVALATEIETAALRDALELDAGESQLAAIVIMRQIAVLETGDKRAIQALERLLTVVPALAWLCGRLRCLEQVVGRCLNSVVADDVARAVCAEPRVDRTMSICCGCFGPRKPALDLQGLVSYIRELRTRAPRMLEM